MGDIQSALNPLYNPNATFPNIHASDILTCHAPSGRLLCTLRVSPLEHLDHIAKPLPTIRGNHLLKINGTHIHSTLLSSAPVTLTLEFVDYSVTVSSNKVCPIFVPESFVLVGCYNCLEPALLSFSIRSQCHDGPTTFTLTPALLLQTSEFITREPHTVELPIATSMHCPINQFCALGSVSTSPVCISLPTLCLEESEVNMTRTIITRLEGGTPIPPESPSFLSNIVSSVGTLGQFIYSTLTSLFWLPLLIFAVIIILLFLFGCVVTLSRR